ncbi:uncharacterized protein LOC109140694 isoform X2 [Larimichthys crocea]|uniref:uncharacterized protein LOC109140694 isoform X2 n=1 Tax=Larimichthys crocea TaxID=215358 RepID=UPI000900C5B0|nr:uncharacterized protein LOC109140694 isoform X2 [Larimichthys crocea]
MLTMRLTFLLALYFMCVSSTDEYLDDVCETQTLSAKIGSSVLLPCIFSTNNLTNWVSWTHTAQMEYLELVNLTSKGQINFANPRDGRIKVYPNQGSEGNYSISIDELEISDLGGYCCKHRHRCVEVDLVAETGTNEKMLLLIFICVGAAAFILLIVGGYGCMKCILWCCKRRQDYTVHLTGGGVSAPPAEIGVVPDDQQRGADNLVYENDDQGPVNQQGHGNHPSIPGACPGQDRAQSTESTTSIYPNLGQFHLERMESQRKKQRFHTELLNRLRPASLSRHFYANQGEIARQQAMSAQAENHRKGLEKKKAKAKCEYKNPIYNRSTDHLNHL